MGGMHLRITVNGETIAGLNFHGFHPMKFFTGNFHSALRLQHLSNVIIQSL